MSQSLRGMSRSLRGMSGCLGRHESKPARHEWKPHEAAAEACEAWIEALQTAVEACEAGVEARASAIHASPGSRRRSATRGWRSAGSPLRSGTSIGCLGSDGLEPVISGVTGWRANRLSEECGGRPLLIHRRDARIFRQSPGLCHRLDRGLLIRQFFGAADAEVVTPFDLA